jgi:hypothetical protein
MLHTGRLGKHFDIRKQTAFIQSHGQQVVVWPCVQCACLLDDKQFNPTCAGCHGTGRFYPDAAQYVTVLLMAAEDSKRTYNEPGSWTSGSIAATILPGVRLSERDKVRLVDIRDSANDTVLYKGLDDALRHTSGIVIELVVDLLRGYRAGVDYRLQPPNIVEWLPGGLAPAFGAQYSVRYSYSPEFLVVEDTPRLRVEHRLPQAQEVRLQRLDRLSEEF